MALFLPFILAFYSFIFFGGASYQRHIGILGGPTVSAAEPDYSIYSAAMLESVPSISPSGALPASKSSLIDEGIMETALFSGIETSSIGQQAGKTAVSSSSAEGRIWKDISRCPQKDLIGESSTLTMP